MVNGLGDSQFSEWAPVCSEWANMSANGQMATTSV
jgi:hypothetical protein